VKTAQYFSALVTCSFVAASACSTTDEERYPFAEECKGSACRPVLAVVGGGGGAASTAVDAGPSAPGSLEVDVVVTHAASVNLSVTEADSDETATVSLAYRTDVSAKIKGFARIALPRDAFPGWLRVTVQNRQKFTSTLRFTDGAETPLELVTVDRRLFEDVALGLVSPVELEPSASVVVLSIRDKTGAPVPGVSLSSTSAAALAQSGRARLAYDFGDSFSDATQETGEQAGVLLLNMPSPTSMLGAYELVLDRSGVEQKEVLSVEPGGVTIRRVLWTGG
jgi:hypothetical protein